MRDAQPPPGKQPPRDPPPTPEPTATRPGLPGPEGWGLPDQPADPRPNPGPVQATPSPDTAASPAPHGPPPATTGAPASPVAGAAPAATPTQTAQPVQAAPEPAPGPGILEGLWQGAQRAADLYAPDLYTFGFAFGDQMQAQGVALVSAPMLDDGPLPFPNDPFDFTTADRDPANSFVANFRGKPMFLDPLLPPSFDPKAPSNSVVVAAEVESQNVWTGRNPLTRIEAGFGRIDRIDNPVTPLALISNFRVTENFAENQTVLSGNLSLNAHALPLAGHVVRAAAGIAKVVPQLRAAAPHIALASMRLDKATAEAKEKVTPCFGVGWRVEARFDNPADGKPMRFDGLYRRGEKVPLPGFVADSINQELANPSNPGDMVSGVASRMAVNGTNAATDAMGLPRAHTWDDIATAQVNAATDAVGLPRAETWDDNIPPEVVDGMREADRFFQETLADAENPTTLSPMPIPGMSLPGSLLKNGIEEAFKATTGEVPPWMQTLLDPRSISRPALG